MKAIKRFFARTTAQQMPPFVAQDPVVTAKTWPKVRKLAAKHGYDADAFTRRAYIDGQWTVEFGQAA